MQVPYTVVIGEKEIENNIVAPRVRGDLLNHDPKTLSAEDFLGSISKEIELRSKTSLLE
jgi:threonyl-tRNA synthetase